MTSETAAPSRRDEYQRPLVPLLWRVLGLIAFLVVASHDVAYITTGLPGSSGYGTLGIAVSPEVRADGYIPIDSVWESSPAAAAGLRTGDLVRFDRSVDALRQHLPVGESVGLTLARGDARTHLDLTAAPRPTHLRWATLLLGSMSLFVMLVGGFVAVRSLRERAGFLLGMSLVCLGLTGTYLTLWENDARFALAVSVVLSIAFSATPVLFLAFARAFRAEMSISGQDRRWSMIFWLYCGVQGLFLANGMYIFATARALPLIGDLFAVFGLWVQLGYLLAVTVLLRGRRESQGVVRTRYNFLILAWTLLVVGIQGIGFAINLTGNNWALTNPLVQSSLVLTTTGALTFAYALLRHRLIDLGFAINRTLVYGVLSTVLLVAFGLAEWAFEKFVPLHSHEASALISGGIALGIFLVFHRARDLVEKTVEHVFFRRWRENEERLGRFVREAAFVTRPEALRRAAVDEFRRFSGGAPVALYSADSTGVAKLDGGLDALPDEIDPDNTALVRLRAVREPLLGDDARPLNAELVVPMIHRSEISGFFALGAKPNGETWRPDETALLAEAARKIGLDLHALQVEHLRQRVGTLDAQLKLALGMTGTPATA